MTKSLNLPIPNSTINGYNNTMKNIDILNARSRYWNREVQGFGHLVSESGQFDNVQNYSDGFGAIYHPLVEFGDTDHVNEGRGVLINPQLISNN
jgi:hypothetical protein